jgi:hypothetical protein
MGRSLRYRPKSGPDLTVGGAGESRLPISCVT